MTYTILGLGNPEHEHVCNRHNAGRMLVEVFAKKHNVESFSFEKKSSALVAKGKSGTHSFVLALPETYMNKSGTTAKAYIKSKKQAEQLVVCYDDIDLPLGTLRVSFGRSSGGHNGVESVIRAVGTKEFIRIRIGVAPTTPSGKIKKPQGEKKVVDFLMGNFSEKDTLVLKKILAEGSDALACIISSGRVAAMNQFN